MPRVVSMRMSSGPSKRKLKPRSGVSICGELTPESKSTPAVLAIGNSAKWQKPWWRMLKRGSWMVAASAMACGSLSKAIKRPCGPSRLSSSRAWPPRPKVPSTQVPAGCSPCPAKQSVHRLLAQNRNVFGRGGGQSSSLQRVEKTENPLGPVPPEGKDFKRPAQGHRAAGLYKM